MAHRESGSCIVPRRAAAFFVSVGLAVSSSTLKRSVRAVLAGSLLGRRAGRCGDRRDNTASTATVIRVIPAGNNPVAVSLR